MIVDELIALLGYRLTGQGDLNKFNSGIKGAERNLAAFAATAARWGAIAGAALGAGAVLFGKSIISTNAQFEKFHATLEILEGSSAKADESFAWIKTFAKTTPFEVAEVTDAFVRLRSYGINPTDGTLRAVGDAASAMGKTLGEGVEALADAATNEFERLKQFGVTASVAGDQVAFSWQENGKTVTKTVKKNGQEISAFLVGNFSRFKGAMDKQSKTWNGMISNLSDTWTNFLSLIGQSGFFNFAEERLQRLLDWTNKISEDGTLARWAENVSNAIIAVANIVGFLVDRLIRDGSVIATWLAKLDPNIVKAFGAALLLLAAYLFPLTWAFGLAIIAIDDFLGYLEGADSKFGDFVKWIQDMTGASEGLAQALAAIAASLLLIAGMRVFSLLGAVGKLFAGVGSGAAGELAAGGAAARSGGLLGAIKGGLGGALTAAFAAASLNYGESTSRTNTPEFRSEWDDYLTDTMTQQRGYDRGGMGGSVRGKKYRRGMEPGTPGGENADPGGFSSLLANMNANIAKLATGAQPGAIVTDNSQDNRSYPVTVNSSVVQNITEAAAASAAGAATSAAVGQAAVAAASRIEKEPAF